MARPLLYIVNMDPRLVKLWSRTTVAEGGCWRWTGPHDRGGYGYTWFAGKQRRVHHLGLSVDKGLTLDELAALMHRRPRQSVDHLCRVRDCWNPGHLELVSHRENTLRGNTRPAGQAGRDACIRGHRLVGRNLAPAGLERGQRRCLLCQRAHSRIWYYASKGRDVTMDEALAWIELRFPDAAWDAREGRRP